LLRGHVHSGETDQPLKHAILTLTRLGSAAKAVVATTGAEGTYEFPDLAPGRYRLRCERNGYMPTNYGGDSPQPLAIGAGQQVSIDFRLLRGGVITGLVLDEDGQPATGATVEAFRPEKPGSSTPPYYTALQAAATAAIRNWRYAAGRATTDDRGVYRIARLTAGTYYVRVNPGGSGRSNPEYSLNPLAPLFYPGVLVLNDARKIEVKSGVEVAGIDFRLRRTTPLRVSGRVVEGQPPSQPERYPAVLAALRYMVALGPLDFPGSRVDNAVVQPDGTFTISPVFPGRYRLSVDGSGMAGAHAERMIDVITDVDGLVIEVSPGAAIKGKLVLEGGTLPTGPPGAPVAVYLRRQDTDGLRMQYTNPSASQPRAPTLDFQVPRVEAGEYELMLYTAEPAPRFYLREVRVSGKPVDFVRVAAGASVEVELAVGFGTGEVAGVLCNEAGQPVVGRVVVHTADPARRVLQRYFKSESTDQNGRFEITGLAPGDYLLIGWPVDVEPAWALDPAMLARLEKFAARVRIPSGGAVEQDARLSPEAAGILRDAAK